MNLRRSRFSRAFLLSLALLPAAARADDWYGWRGPSQDGRSAEKYTENVLSETPDWTYDISTRGAPWWPMAGCFSSAAAGRCAQLL